MSNLGSDPLMQLLEEQPEATESEMHELLRPILRDHFQPAQLTRFQTVIYRPSGNGCHVYNRRYEAGSGEHAAATSLQHFHSHRRKPHRHADNRLSAAGYRGPQRGQLA